MTGRIEQRLLKTLCTILIAIALDGSHAVRAGQACEAIAPTPAALHRGLELGRKSFDALDASGASVALIARAGQDLSRYRLRYSHMGFVVRDHPAGRWTVLHELNRCGTADSSLFEEGLGDFFLDSPFEYRTLIVVPSLEVQGRLVAMLRGLLPERMHETRYNVVAFPFSTNYQNSNQWLLELMAAVLADDDGVGLPVDDRRSAQAWLLANDYRPTTLEIPALTRLGGRLFKANVAFDDHPFDRRMAGRIDAVTVESVVELLRRRGIAKDLRVVALPAAVSHAVRIDAPGEPTIEPAGR